MSQFDFLKNKHLKKKGHSKFKPQFLFSSTRDEIIKSLNCQLEIANMFLQFKNPTEGA